MHGALLVCDLQNSIVAGLGDGSVDVLDAAQKAIVGARAKDVPVIYLRSVFRRGLPEISARNRMYSTLAKSSYPLEHHEPGTELHPAVAPSPDDMVFEKKRVGAFTGNDLELVLRSRGITSLTIAGISTAGCVLTTVRDAADKDFELTILRDACGDRDIEVHNTLMNKVFPGQAEVRLADEWVAGI